MKTLLKSPLLPWLGLWLLASSWLFGKEYFVKAQPAVGAVFVGAGVVLLCVSNLWRGAEPSTNSGPARPLLNVVMLLCLAPALFVLPLPASLGVALLVCAVILDFSRSPASRALSAGAFMSGVILLVQALALAAYTHATARSHDLPWPLPGLLAGTVRLLGVDAAADGADIVLSTMRENHRLGATWELFFDPATVCFVAGAIVALLLATPRATERRSEGTIMSRLISTLRPFLTPATVLLLGIALWLPLRVALLVGAFLHRALRTDYEAPLNLMNQFWSPWTHMLLLLPLALLAARFLRNWSLAPAVVGEPAIVPHRQFFQLSALAFASAAILTLAVLWDPVGKPKQGRIAVDEFHSTWEPTGRPMDTEWYGHLSGYNYACLYDYCSRYYTMSRLTNTLTDAALAGLDVLILKVPTDRFQPAEIDAIVRFVERGGSALLIGEHTDVFNTGYHLNPVARRFGFEFRYDCLFGVQTFFDQYFKPPRVRHPVLQNLRELDFATSCSVDVRGGTGRGVIISTGLKNSMADYHANNYYPQAVDHAEMRSGAFVQLWAARHGRGRVLAFTDSTIFSNFSAFEPGKAELFLGMLEWLNRQDRLGNPRPWLVVIGAALLGWTLLLAVRLGSLPRLTIAAAILGWGATSLALSAHQRSALPVPQPVRPLTWITIDRTVCDGPLSKGGFIAGKPDGFGIFERWILRLGYFIKRRSGLDAAQGDLVVFFQPTKPVSAEYRDALVRYVESGGKLLILDSPANDKSTAAALLEPFQLAQKSSPVLKGTLTNTFDWPVVPVESAREITGGRPLFHIDGTAVGAVARRGKGSVVALGFGSRFADPSMGVTGDVVPDAELRKVFDLQFALLRAIIAGSLEPAPAR